MVYPMFGAFFPFFRYNSLSAPVLDSGPADRPDRPLQQDPEMVIPFPRASCLVLDVPFPPTTRSKTAATSNLLPD